MGLMEGQNPQQLQTKYRDVFIPALIANWKVWPALQVSSQAAIHIPVSPRTLQLINFRFMPLAYRLPFQQTCGIFWTLYLSLLNSRWAMITPLYELTASLITHTERI